MTATHRFWVNDADKVNQKEEKKIKYAEIDFTSYHSFLRLRKVKKINLKLPHSKKTQPTVDNYDLLL
jgi:hypothetical protein